MGTQLIDSTAVIERNEIFSSQSGSAVRRYGRLRVKLPFRSEIQPGQFAMVKAHGVYEPLLRRAMAYFIVEQAETTTVEFIYQILGRGTSALSTLKPGELIDHLGPLGNSFDPDAEPESEVWIAVGGVGSAAVYTFAQSLISRNREIRLFIGGAGKGDLLGLAEFTALLGADRIFPATVDGSFGHHGFVTGPIKEQLAGLKSSPPVIFACGPDAMLESIGSIAEANGLQAYLSLEAPMACGIGICVGCAVPVKADTPEGFIYQKVCTDGPVFENSKLFRPKH